MKRPEDLATPDRERAAFEAVLERFWDGVATRIRDGLERETKALVPFDAVLDWDTEKARLQRILRARSRRLAEAGAWEVLDAYNPDADGWTAAVMDPWLAKAAESNTDQWEASTRNHLVEYTTEPGWEERLAEIAKWAFVASLAVGWATQYLSFGRQDAAKASGLGTKTWHTTSKNPRATHAALNGETVRIDDIFGNGLRYPGDPAGSADDNANCKCRLTYGKAQQ